MRCGSHRWSVSGPFLTLEHEVRPVDRWLHGGSLLWVLAFPVLALTTGFFADDPQAWLLMLGLGFVATHHLLSRWKVLLNLETRTLWHRTGYKETFRGTTYPLESFTSVALYKRGEGPTAGFLITKAYVVALKGPSDTVVLSHSDDREEAAELAQAVSKFLGLGLSVEGGESRSVTARLEEAPLTGERLPDLPYGSGIQFKQDARGLILELPPCGWRPSYAAQGAFAVLIAVAGPVLVLSKLRGMAFDDDFASRMVLIICGFFVAAGAFCGVWVARQATSRWSINASSRGVELTHHGPWRRRKVLRLPRSRIQDVDVRDARTEVSRGRGIVVEHDKGQELLGMDLSKEELEWAGMALRRALATRAGDSSAQLQAS
ncbi:hypothetical protein [Corallococcus sp. EGB]|uniref:hypothetical protein n=1 Tax=Corallococcus sp. EGB TaxID=1521117 RepID=UPI001CBB8FE9|nr:hypothetical protein [Corallococcus sp. EGB]